MLRKHLILFAAMVIVIFCPTQPVLAAADLNQAVEELASNLSTPSQGRVVVAPFTYNQTPTQFSVTVQEKLVTTMVQKGLRIVGRNQLEQVLREQKLTYSGLFNLASAKSVGKLLGAGQMVLGTIQDQGNTVAINARLVDLETADILKATEVTLPKTPVITKELEQALAQPDRSTGGSSGGITPPIQTANAGGFTFTLQTCSRSVGKVTCRLRVTSNERDRNLWLHPDSRIFDENGDEYKLVLDQSWIDG